MSYRIIEVDGVVVDPNTQKFPVEVYPETHAINGPHHTGMLDDSQIPQNIMRDTEHQNDPHTMIIDGRDVSVDGTKLDTIENGAEVNNLTDQQANALIGGSHTNWHHHDSFYYRKAQLQTSGESSVHWDNITNLPSQYPPAPHNHDSQYYTQAQLDSGTLDDRYFTETEITTNYYTKIDLDTGQLDNRYYTENEINNIFQGYYTKTQLNSGQLNNLYYTETEVDGLLSMKSDTGHTHDDRYFTETELNPTAAPGANVLDSRYFTETEITTNYYNKSEVDTLLADAAYGISGAFDYFSELPTTADVGTIYIIRQGDGTNAEGFYRWDGSAWVWLAHNVSGIYHNDLLGLNQGNYIHLNSSEYTELTSGSDTSLHLHDDRYYTETEIDGFLSNKSNKGHHHDDRYYTESEVNTLFTNYYTKTQLDPQAASGNNILDDRYFTEAEIISNYYTKSDLDTGRLDSRYYTETEIDNQFSNYYTNSDLDSGQLDSRYYTETELNATFDLYFTKTEVLNGALDSRYYTESQLSGGVLDSRYYTEAEIDNIFSNYYTKTELNNGQLDSRYYTETEVDNLLSNKSDVGHTHDDRYYTETELSTDSIAEVHWSNLTNIPTEFNPSSHTHDDLYYTESELDNGQLDNRYYTETELDAMIAAAAYGITDSVDLQSNLPSSAETGEIYIVNAETDPQNEGFYRWNGSAWVYLAPNTGATSHNNLAGLDTGDYYHMDTNENAALTQGNDASSYHHHDSQYYTEIEIDGFLASKSDIGHAHNDIYYTEAEVDNKLSNKSDVGHIHDDRYYTETEIDASFYTQVQLNNGQLDSRYYTETEVDTLLLNKSDTGHIHDDRYYTEAEVDNKLSNKSNVGHVHDDRYYTETEIDAFILNYYTKNELDTGQLDNRYYTETELDPGANTGDNVLDSRYFTEAEIISNYYTKSDLDTGQLDSRYYTETEIDGALANYYSSTQLDSGQLDNRYYTESEINSNFYTKSQLNTGQLDNRYYTEPEVDAMITAVETFGIKGGVDYFTDLPAGAEGEIYIVRFSDGTNTEGFYRHDGSAWVWLAANIGITQHNDLQGLNAADYKHLTNSEYTSLTGGSDTTLHSHNGQYYTETEVDNLLSNKSNTGHSHNDLYYTESEIDGLLLNKSDTGHIHDSRYYTKGYINTNFYTKSQLNNGQLDSRYYTETEADGLLASKSDVGHTHDDRYYTETEIDTTLNQYYTKSELDNGQLDNLYYTETEIDNIFSNYYTKVELHNGGLDWMYYRRDDLDGPGGAGIIGVVQTAGITSSNVQDALEELQSEISNSSSNLQEAYESGNTISTSDAHGPVKLSGGSTPALEISNQGSVPTQHVSPGSIAVIDNMLYIFDGGRNKWLTQSKLLAFGRHVASGHMLSQANVWDWYSGYRIIRHSTIIGFSLESTSGPSGKDVYILVNGSVVHTLATDANAKITADNLNIDINKNDVISIYVESGGPPLKDVVVLVEIAWRKT